VTWRRQGSSCACQECCWNNHRRHRPLRRR
jgi:hypothetical protein